jgi:hypothetical protein
MTDLFYLFANCNFVPDRYEDVRVLRRPLHGLFAKYRQWQSAYDDLAKYVYAEEKTTMSYYFGIPMEYANNISATTMMLAFEVYGKREVRV